jgi:hypothetical protein
LRTQVDPDKPDCAFPVPGEGMEMLNLDGRCHAERVARELVEGFEFEPRCLVLVLAGANEREMFDDMLARGRLMSDPFHIEINYTVATGAGPPALADATERANRLVKLAGTNCGLSRVLRRNHALDATGQAELAELQAVRDGIRVHTDLVAFWRHLMHSQALVSIDADGKPTLRPPSASPPPPPPPWPAVPPGAPAHPPAPPEQLSHAMQTAAFEDELTRLEAREAELVQKHRHCFGSRVAGTVCGLSANEAPDPFVALNGVKCAGHARKSARALEFCGYWDDDTNPLASDRKLRAEQLKVGPYCLSEAGAIARCSPNASRTQRSGVADLAYMTREDREFCEFKFARERLAPEAGDDAEACRADLAARSARCQLSCDVCKAECTSEVARTAVAAWKCSVGLPRLALAVAFQSSDVGVDIAHRWGAQRTEGRPAAPDGSFQEQYRTMVHNNIEAPIAPRNGARGAPGGGGGGCARGTRAPPPLPPPAAPLCALSALARTHGRRPGGRSDLVPEATHRVRRRNLPPAAQRQGRTDRAQRVARQVQNGPGLRQPVRCASGHRVHVRVHAWAAVVFSRRAQPGRLRGARRRAHRGCGQEPGARAGVPRGGRRRFLLPGARARRRQVRRGRGGLRHVHGHVVRVLPHGMQHAQRRQGVARRDWVHGAHVRLVDALVRRDGGAQRRGLRE